MPKKLTRIVGGERSTYPLSQDTIDSILQSFDDLVAFYTKCDILEHGDTIVPEKESQKKCRFCY